MKKTIILSAFAAAATIAMSASAHACPNGYKPVWIQGNKVCKLDSSARNKLKVKTNSGRESRGDIGQKLQFKLQEANN